MDPAGRRGRLVPAPLRLQHSRSNRDHPDGTFLTCDLYDDAGGWQREVSFACEDDTETIEIICDRLPEV